VWKRLEVLERNNLSASYLGHLIPHKELLVPIELEAGVGFGASLAVFWMGEKSGTCPKSSPRSLYRWYFPSSPNNSNIVLNIILNIFRDKVLIIGEVKDRGIFVQLKSLLFGWHLSILPYAEPLTEVWSDMCDFVFEISLSFASCSNYFMYILKLEL